MHLSTGRWDSSQQKLSTKSFYSPEEDKDINKMIQEFYRGEQVRYTQTYNFNLNADYMKRMTWYIELDQNLKRWKEKLERERQASAL